MILANTLTQTESLLHSLEQASRWYWPQCQCNKTEYMCSYQNGESPFEISGQVHLPGSSVSSTEKDINIWLAKAWTTIDRLSIIWKSNLSDKIKRNIFHVVVVSILLYGCTTWTLTKRMRENETEIAQESYESYWTNPGSNIIQSSSCTATDFHL